MSKSSLISTLNKNINFWSYVIGGTIVSVVSQLLDFPLIWTVGIWTFVFTLLNIVLYDLLGDEEKDV